jgi:hypothetical protein
MSQAPLRLHMERAAVVPMWPHTAIRVREGRAGTALSF